MCITAVINVLLYFCPRKDYLQSHPPDFRMPALIRTEKEREREPLILIMELVTSTEYIVNSDSL
jgi:hypothetical protein